VAAAVELTCMCMVYDRDQRRVLVQDRIKNWRGINFPGGHVEDGEGLTEAAIREVKEETGLTVSDLEYCGVIHWYDETRGSRYMVFSYRTCSYRGRLVESTEEGRVFWADIDELPRLGLSEGFEKQLPIFFDEKTSEGFSIWRGSGPDPFRWY